MPQCLKPQTAQPMAPAAEQCVREQGQGKQQARGQGQGSPNLQLRRLSLQLQHLELQKQPVISQSVKHVQSAFGDLLSLPPTALIQPTTDSFEEAMWWDCFASVYEQEVQQLQQGSEKELPKEKRRQILADILVWAEITQSHYDTNTASFVTDPHGGDASFQRIGKLLKAAKQQRGLA